MSRIIIVSNRLPVKVSKVKSGFKIQNSAGGLATGLSSLSSTREMIWVGWPGYSTSDEEERSKIENKMDPGLYPVFMTPQEERNFYEGFSNETIWPLFHCFSESVNYSNRYWKYYQAINQRFCDKVAEIAEPGDIIWVQDYHLMLLPSMLKQKLYGNPIGFFLHIPFPSYELFRTLPWREEILEGMLGADLVGFHTYEYMRHFHSSVYRLLGYDAKLGAIQTGTSSSFIDCFPMGINYEKFHDTLDSPKVAEQVQIFKDNFGHTKLIMSVDRLDYTKGILNRLQAFERLLTRHPELREKVSLIMITVPSRAKVKQYRLLKESIDELVGKINGKFSTLDWTAIHYFYRSIPFERLQALYHISDVGLVTPLRDGMNLVAKEYVASKKDNNGVLILSEMAGSAIELEEALKVNPHDGESIVQALRTALTMPEEEQRERLLKMQQRVKTNSVDKWAQSFISHLTQIVEDRKQRSSNVIMSKNPGIIGKSFHRALKPLVILDYDGTLVAFKDDPAQAIPSKRLYGLLEKLVAQAHVAIVSGREHHDLDKWFAHTGVDLIAEHGMWVRKDGEWQKQHENRSPWKGSIRKIMNTYADRTPGAFIESKSSSLAFHYRKTDKFLAEMRIPLLIRDITQVCVKHQLEILQGNKVCEIRVSGINKGTAVKEYVSELEPDFIMAIGDDRTDEDMFAVLPSSAYTIKVGEDDTIAQFRIENPEKVKELLAALISEEERGKIMKKKLIEKQSA